MNRLRTQLACTLSAALVAAALLSAPASAQDERQQGGGFLDNLFSRGEGGTQRQGSGQAPGGQVAQSDPGELAVRLDRMENTLRQLTGTIEQLQYRNQQLEMQLKRVQDEQVGGRGATSPAAPSAPPAATPGRRGDLFDPAQNPNAPGAPRTLGNPSAAAPVQPPIQNAGDEPVGAPGGRAAGAPLDLSTLAANAGVPQTQPPSPMASAGPVASAPPATQGNAAPAPQGPARNVGAPATKLATLPPSASPQDEYDLAYGYVLHKDYALAEQAFRDFIKKHPNERLLPDAQYWLGESLFQRQRYRDAAESFLAVSTKHERAGKAPDSLLRLGQSLAAMNQKEAACATLAEVGRKYPRASATVKRSVTQEQKRVRC